MQRLISSSARTIGTRTLRCTTSCQPFNMSRRFITEDSWAAEQLTKKGEKLGPGVAGDMLVTESMVFNATPKVKELAEKFLELNAVEAAQLLKVIQVLRIVGYFFLLIFLILHFAFLCRVVLVCPTACSRGSSVAEELPGQPLEEMWPLTLAMPRQQSPPSPRRHGI